MRDCRLKERSLKKMSLRRYNYSMNFIIASNNKNKIAEFKRILLPLNVNVFSAKDVDVSLEDVEETGKTFEENAKIKARAFFECTHMPSIADDSGLMVDALGGEPGIYSARYAGEGATDKQKIEKLLGKLKDIPEEKRTAKFVTAICCLFPDKKEILVRGECVGKIAFEPVGENGFGYDPVFIPDAKLACGRTFAQLAPAEKDKISHRGEALRNFERVLKDMFNKGEVVLNA